VTFAAFDLRPVDGINILILLVVVWILVRVINSDANSLVWADFISTRGADGSQRGDLNKIGQLVGIVVAAMTVLMYADNQTVDAIGLSALLGVALAYLGGVTAYAAFLRSRQGSVETTKTTDFMPPTTRTETKVETAPTKGGTE
jgi:hypothetical protein